MSKKKREEAMRRRRKQARARQQRRSSSAVDSRLVKMDIHREVAYIIERAQTMQARLVTLANLVLFSTETQDAWLLDAEDSFALCLLRDGQPQPYRIVDTPDTFAIEWNAKFEIDGNAFLVLERDGKVRTVIGYPTDQIAEACGRCQ